MDQPSEPVLKQKQRGPASRTTGATAASSKGAATPATVKPPVSQSGLDSIFKNYIATAAAAPVPSGPPKVNILFPDN